MTTAIRITLGVIALTALAVGMVCGVLSRGSDTVAWCWLAAAVTGLLWDILRAYQTDWVRDPITLPPSRIVRTPLQLRIDLHNAAQAYHDHHSPEHKAVWPASNGAPE